MPSASYSPSSRAQGASTAQLALAWLALSIFVFYFVFGFTPARVSEMWEGQLVDVNHGVYPPISDAPISVPPRRSYAVDALSSQAATDAPPVSSSALPSAPPVPESEDMGPSAAIPFSDTSAPWFKTVLSRINTSDPIYNSTVFVIPVNGGFIDFGLNLWCSLKAVKREHSAIFLAMEPKSAAALAKAKLPFYEDPFITTHLHIPDKAAAFGKNPGFVAATCGKFAAILRLVQRGLTAVLLDADLTFVADPLQAVIEETGALPTADITWSWGGHRNPMTDTTAPSCAVAVTDGPCYMNTGFYVANPTKGAIAVLQEAIKRCDIYKTDDQTVLNDHFISPIRKGKATWDGEPFHIACFNPCAWQNGNTAFVHRVWPTVEGGGDASSSASSKDNDSSPPTSLIAAKRRTMVHANFLKGGVLKKTAIQNHGLWDVSCHDEA